MIYYISGISKPNFDVNKLQSELSKQSSVYISELSILEIYSHFRNDLLTLKIILNYLHINNYMVLPFLDEKHTIVNNKFNELIGKDDTFLKYLADDSLRIRIEIESRFLNYWSTCIASIYLATYYKNKPINKNINKELSNKIINAIIILNENNNIYSSNFWNILYDFYSDYDEKLFKDKVVEHILDKCMTFTNLLYVSFEGIDFMDFIENVDKYDADLKERLLKNISDDQFIKKIEKRKQCKKGLIDKSFLQALDDNLEYFENKINKIMNSCILKYSIILFKKFLTLENKKIEKNNVIDSLLLSYYPNNLIITSDSDFLKFMEEIDTEYYKKIKTFIEKTKRTNGA
jgi:hypothetical protein